MPAIITSFADTVNQRRDQKISVARRTRNIDGRRVSMGRRIKDARDAAGLSQEALAERVGASQSAVANWETGQNSPRRHLIPKIAKTLSVTPEFLEFGGETPRSNTLPDPSSTELRGAAFGAIHASALGGDGEKMVVYGDTVEYRPKPQRWANVKGLYGFYVVGDSMEPRINSGELVWVHPHRSPAVGQEAVFIRKVADGDEPVVLVKVFAGATAKEWTVRQFKPERTFKLLKSEWDVQIIVDIDLNR